jgi:hypothetical protein
MSGPPVSRRAAVRWAGAVSVAGAFTLGGCDLDPRSSPTPAAAPTPDHDERILLAARAELTDLIARLRASAARPDQIDPDALVLELQLVHVEQLTALGGTRPTSTVGVRPLDGRRLLPRERLAIARFTEWAEHAESGDLARVLAATAAGTRSQLSKAGLR